MSAHTVAIIEPARGVTIGDRIEVASSLWSRGRGLLGRSSLPNGGGLLIVPCNSIHSFFMRFRFDALFLDRDYRVLYIIHAMAPWRVSKLVRGCHAVLELPPGVAKAAGIALGDQLRVDAA